MTLDSGTQKLLGMCLELVQEIEDAPDNENPLYLAKLRDLLSEAVGLLGTDIEETHELLQETRT